jgi:hypothetical protein
MSAAAAAPANDMNQIAEQYVKLVLAVGLHDSDYVDAYYGPAEWKQEVERAKPPLARIRSDAEKLVAKIEAAKPESDELGRLRQRYLLVQTRSLARRVEMLEGKRFGFDEESRHLYDAVAPTIPESRFERVLQDLERSIPGSGPLAERYEQWQKGFFVPAAKLDAVFRATVDEARARTRRHMRLPEGESFRIEYVKNQVWSAYNWYQGQSHSLIQVNLDLPVEVDGALRLASHEGYPGHHVYNALLEERLVRARGWMEYSAYPLYSPQSLIAEGTAEYGVELAFPPKERGEFYAKELFPRAGFDPGGAEAYAQVKSTVGGLSHAGNQAARRFLDGRSSKEECQAYLVRYALMPPARAAQRVRFIEKMRAYVINYNLGQDLVRDYLAKVGGGWKEFEALLSSPRLPSGL